MMQLSHSTQLRSKMSKNVKMNRKGFLLGEFALKMLVAIVCIVILLFLLYKIYGNFTGQTELSQAESSMNSIGEEISSAVLSNAVRNYIVVNPRDWILVYFGEDVQKPDKCNGKCLCICEQVGWGGVIGGDQKTSCNKQGVCKNVGYQIIGFDKQVIYGPIQLEIKRAEKVENGVSILVK